MSKRVESALEAAIKAGELGPQLPGIRDLESMLGVSRTSIQPALNALVAKGMLVQAGPRRRIRVANDVGTGSGKAAARKILMLESSKLGSRMMISTVIAASLANRPAAKNWIIDHQVIKADQSRSNVKRWQRLLDSSGADALIVVAGTRNTLDWASGCGVPVLALGGDTSGFPIPAVGYDSDAMATMALDRLLATGHRDICFPLGVRSPSYVGEMERAMIDAFARHGVGFQPKLHFPQWHSNVPEAWREGLHWRFGSRRPDALVLANVRVYQTCLGVLMELGLKVPDDLSLVVLGEQSELTWFHPIPASFDLDPLRLADKIASWIDSPKNEQSSFILQPKWLDGGSIRERNS
ncbi:MAG: LacI family DNA-binding transcriptional regulator [Verrucomicrobia bacterium]|nr:LacI family DNA-binding transcriptional regulator [Verrucomicrobiota bacterium]